jgi:chromosome segregation ATPase
VICRTPARKSARHDLNFSLGSLQSAAGLMKESERRASKLEVAMGELREQLRLVQEAWTGIASQREALWGEREAFRKSQVD